LCGDFRESRDRLVPSNAVVSLEEFTEDDWSKAETEREIIHNAAGTFDRTRGVSGWERSPSGLIVTNEIPFAGKNSMATGTGFSPLLVTRQGTETGSPIFDIKALRKNPDVVWSRGKASWKSASQSGTTTVAWVLEFDSETRIKTHERVWLNSHLIQEETWQTDVTIDPKQFKTPILAPDGVHNGGGSLRIMKHDDTADKWLEPLPPYVFHTRAEPPAGIGVIILDQTGPFKVLGVIEGGPAQKAGIHDGDILTGIDGANLASIPLLLFLSLCHGQVGSPVTIDIEEASTGEHKRFELQRAELKASHISNKPPAAN
jgi:hypothetical protein